MWLLILRKRSLEHIWADAAVGHGHDEPDAMEEEVLDLLLLRFCLKALCLLQEVVPFFDCKTASLNSQQRTDSLPQPDPQGAVPTFQPEFLAQLQSQAAWQSLELELWPLEEKDKLAAQVNFSSG